MAAQLLVLIDTSILLFCVLIFRGGVLVSVYIICVCFELFNGGSKNNAWRTTPENTFYSAPFTAIFS
jgi:hypothetical protein